MCLISRRKSPHRLKRDMRCWKLVYKSVGKDTFKPIYYDRNTEYRLNKTHFERSKLREQIALNTVEGLYHGIVPIVCECVIPAGTTLYSNRKEHEVCARRLRFDKILEL